MKKIISEKKINNNSAIAVFFRTFTVGKLIKLILTYAWLLFMVTVVLLPVLWMISAAFTNTDNLSNVPVIPDFSRFSLENYRHLFTYSSDSSQEVSDYLRSFFTTFLVAVTNTVLVVIFSCLVGFSFSRFRFKGKKQALLSMMGLQMFPSFMGMLAIFMFFRQFGLLNNPFALTLVYTAGAIPYNTFIVRGFMRNIPKSLDEAARIDGASNLQIMFKIIIPLAVPIMGFIAVNAFMAPWLDYILPSVLMTENTTVAVHLFRLLDTNYVEHSVVGFMAGALFLAVPIMLVQIYMQKYVVYGLTSGADKG